MLYTMSYVIYVIVWSLFLALHGAIITENLYNDLIVILIVIRDYDAFITIQSGLTGNQRIFQQTKPSIV